jgi:hypothetical protein
MNKISAPAACTAAVLLACLSLPALAQQDPVGRAELPVSRVVLFTSGIGYFEHSGTVEGTAELELPVAAEQMDDLLQSLVLQDFDGGSVQPVRYASRDPLGRILASYSLDLSRDPTLAELLAQARGESVLVVTSEPIRGTIVNVEHIQPPEEEQRTYLTLATADGLQRLLLGDVRRIRFERSELQEELEAALAALAEYRGSDESRVVLRFSGNGTRRVSVGYVREMPVWKTSYRLVLEEDIKALLQGWAIFDNPTSLDLNEVEVSFVAGQPISFISSLFEPVYLERPRVGLSLAPGVVPPAYAGEAAPRPAARPAGMEMMDSAAVSTPAFREALRAGGAGVTAMAEGARTGATFVYTVSEPVTISRHQSAMIPILQQEVEAPLLSLFDPSVLPRNPLSGVRLSNGTGLHLAAGPMSVFDQGGFAGNSRIADVVPGDSRLLTFAVDLELEVDRGSSSEPEEVTAVTIRNGVLETVSRQRVRSEYRVSPRGDLDAGRFLVI